MRNDAYLPERPNVNGIHLSEIVRNAIAEGVDLSEIALLYEDLTVIQLQKLKLHGLYVDESSKCIRGRFTKEGLVMFPDHVKSILYL